ncbi:MAG: type 1 glutamine amidotransferase [Candidatus Lokiarchaeota archaeon]|nr:type 1 glutamine amidotransferase [Candidatus Lokiarchaeota archaeon]
MIDFKKIAIIATNGYEDLELHYPRIRLIEAGFDVDIISLDHNIIKGKYGYPIKPDLTIEEAKTEDYDGVILPGGTLNPDYLRRNKTILKFIEDLDKEKKMVSAICHAGWVLISAKIIKGRKVTSYFAIKDDIINAGALFEDSEVIIDNNLITSRCPDDLPEYMKVVLAYLK